MFGNGWAIGGVSAKKVEGAGRWRECIGSLQMDADTCDGIVPNGVGLGGSELVADAEAECQQENL